MLIYQQKPFIHYDLLKKDGKVYWPFNDSFETKTREEVDFESLPTLRDLLVGVVEVRWV